MTFKDWIDSKGLDVIKEELEEILADIKPCKVVFDSDDEWFYFALELEDGSCWNTDFELMEEVDDDYSSKQLLIDLFDASWEAYCDFPVETFTGPQVQLLERLKVWEQRQYGLYW